MNYQRVDLIGATARTLLTRPTFAGRVLAVVSGAVYLTGVIASEAKQSPNRDLGIASSQKSLLAMTDGEVLWLVQNHLPMHARALRGDFDLSALRVGMSFQSDGACLQFDVGAQRVAPLLFVDARVWQPATIDPARVAPREVVNTRAKKWCTAAQGKHTGLPLQDEIARVCRDRDLKRVADAARALIGLGEGLTPSGDDFVGGLLFAVYHLRAAYPSAFHWEQRAIDDLLEYARARTNTISYALLRDHARGQSVEPLHDWLAALLDVDEQRDMAKLVARLIGIGSTTGKNLLAGAATAMSLPTAE